MEYTKRLLKGRMPTWTNECAKMKKADLKSQIYPFTEGGPNVSQEISHFEMTWEWWGSEGINIEVVPAGSSRVKDQSLSSAGSIRARAKWQKKVGRKAFVSARNLWARQEQEIKAQSIHYQVNNSVERILTLQGQENADGHFLLLNNSSLVRQGQAPKLTNGESTYAV